MNGCDAELMAQSLSDPPVFGSLYDRHAAVLFRFLVRRVGPDMAGALLGETFRIAFERRATFNSQSPTARPWLYGIATNVIAKHRRGEARRLAAMAALSSQRGAAQDDPADRVAARVDGDQLWPDIADAIAQLPAGERDALLLFAWEELSYQEIADALNIPVGTVRSRLNRARRRLRECAEQGGKGERGD